MEHREWLTFLRIDSSRPEGAGLEIISKELTLKWKKLAIMFPMVATLVSASITAGIGYVSRLSNNQTASHNPPPLADNLSSSQVAASPTPKSTTLPDATPSTTIAPTPSPKISLPDKKVPALHPSFEQAGLSIRWAEKGGYRVTYKVEPKQTLTDIANKYVIRIKKIKELNLDKFRSGTDQINLGATLTLPLSVQPYGNGYAIVYEAQEGVTLGGIAERYHIDRLKFAKANNIAPYAGLQTGKKYLIPLTAQKDR
jgi:LysM repeat protein